VAAAAPAFLDPDAPCAPEFSMATTPGNRLARSNNDSLWSITRMISEGCMVCRRSDPTAATMSSHRSSVYAQITTDMSLPDGVGPWRNLGLASITGD